MEKLDQHKASKSRPEVKEIKQEHTPGTPRQIIQELTAAGQKHKFVKANKKTNYASAKELAKAAKTYAASHRHREL